MAGPLAVIRPTKAIIIAAGQGSRLRPFTDTMPKSMVEVGGKRMMVRLLEQLRSVGVTDIVVIRGYKGEYFEEHKEELGPGVRFVENPDFKDNNILLSLFKAEAELKGDLYISYSDVIYVDDVLPKLAEHPAHFGLVVDRDWREVYVGRTDHPIEQAELCEVKSAEDDTVVRVGKCSCEADAACGEFTGLVKLSAANTERLVESFHAAAEQCAPDKPFTRAKTWPQSYLCDLLEFMCRERSIKMQPCFIDGGTLEIDTVQDRTRAQDKTEFRKLPQQPNKGDESGAGAAEAPAQ